MTVLRGGPRYICERFYERPLECCDLLDEEVLVNGCLRDMIEEYRIFLENLMEAACCTNETLPKTSRSNLAMRGRSR